jgi:hypothetical protein
VPGIVDLVGPRADGALVAAAGDRLVLVREDGSTAPFTSLTGDVSPLTHIAMAPGLDVPGSGCRFGAGEVYAIQSAPQAVVSVPADGQPFRLVEPPPTDRLTGIAFDATGRFGNQLLVAGRKGDRTVLFSIDCRGRLRTLTESAPPMAGGMAVAPQMFGNHGGDLIGADEVSGDLVFIRYDGTSGILINPGLPAGRDAGPASVGFLPPGFIGRAGTAYVADRGAGAVWRLTEDRFSQVGIDENDLMVATEANGLTRVIRCRATCRVFPLGGAPGARFQGHITVVLGPAPPPLPRAGDLGTLIFVISTGVIVAGGVVLFLLHNRKVKAEREPAG